MVILEMVKTLEYSLAPQKCYFYRTQSGTEVDLVLADVTIREAYEIKFSMKPNVRMLSGLKTLKKDFPEAKLALLTLSKDFPGIPQHGDISYFHWYEAILQK